MAAGLGDQQHRDTVQQSESKRSDFETNSSAPILETMGGELKGKEQWSTKNLSQRLVVDAGCAIAAGAAVAPVVSMIDR